MELDGEWLFDEGTLIESNRFNGGGRKSRLEGDPSDLGRNAEENGCDIGKMTSTWLLRRGR